MALYGIKIKPENKGKLHRDLGKKSGTKLSAADLQKAKRSKDPAERKRANFAINARKWHHGKGGKSTSDKLYGSK